MHASADGPAPQQQAISPATAADEEPGPEPVDPDLSAAVSHSLAQTVEARLRGVRNYTRMLRDIRRPT